MKRCRVWVTINCTVKTKKRSWIDAEALCELEGGHLVVIDSELELQYVRNIAIKHKENNYMGLHNQYKEGQYSVSCRMGNRVMILIIGNDIYLVIIKYEGKVKLGTSSCWDGTHLGSCVTATLVSSSCMLPLMSIESWAATEKALE